MNYEEPIHPIGGDGAIAIGLTKLEYVSAICMNGFLANPNMMPRGSRKEITQMSVSFAAQLIKEIEFFHDERSQACEHEPLTSYHSGVRNPTTYCSKCGAELICEWRESK